MNSSTAGSIAISSDRGRPVGRDRDRARGCPRRRAPGRRAPPMSAEHQALREQLPRDAPPARAERGMNRQLLLPSLGAHQEQVGDVGARDQQHDADRAEQDPEHLADVADDVLRQRPDVRPDPRLLEHLPGEPGRQREALDDHRQHPRDVGVGLLDGDARLQPRDPLVAEVADEDLGAVEAERQRRSAGCGRGSGSLPAGRR